MLIRLGLGSYTFAWAIDVPGYRQPRKPLSSYGLLGKAGALGVDLVQICANLPLQRLDHEDFDPGCRVAVKMKTGLSDKREEL